MVMPLFSGVAKVRRAPQNTYGGKLSQCLTIISTFRSTHHPCDHKEVHPFPVTDLAAEKDQAQSTQRVGKTLRQGEDDAVVCGRIRRDI